MTLFWELSSQQFMPKFSHLNKDWFVVSVRSMTCCSTRLKLRKRLNLCLALHSREKRSLKCAAGFFSHRSKHFCDFMARNCYFFYFRKFKSHWWYTYCLKETGKNIMQLFQQKEIFPTSTLHPGVLQRRACSVPEDANVWPQGCPPAIRFQDGV